MSYEANDDSFPGRAVAYIISTWGSQSFVSSGVLVGRNDVLTASHAVYDAALGGRAEEVKIYLSYDPDDSNQDFFTAAEINYYDDFDPNHDGLIYSGDNQAFTLGGSEKDIALLSLSEAAGDTYGWFGINFTFSAGPVGILGFPHTYNHNLTFDSGYAARDQVDNYIDTSNLEVNFGNSGGPIFTGNGADVSVVGVVSTGVAAASVTAHQAWLTSIISANDSYITTAPLPPPVTETPANAIFRFYNSQTGTHFYTGDTNERDTIIAGASALAYEGIAFGSADTANNLSGLVNVFRFYNTATGTHFYTANEDERANVTNNLLNYVYEGIAYQGYANDTGDGSSAALHRFFNETTGSHFYTASEAEVASIQTTGTLTYEGIAYYVDII